MESNVPHINGQRLNGENIQFFEAREKEDDYISDTFTDQVVLLEPWHSEYFFEVNDDTDEENPKELGWRLKERTKTAAAVLVVCLNIGTDPPDTVKPNPCARKECWLEPTLPKQKGLEMIGNALQTQYEKLQPKIKYKQCLDPTIDDLRKVCSTMRKAVKQERILFHYNGHGVPRPTRNGEIWLFGKHYTHYLPVSIHDVRTWLGDPAVYLFDCSAAGVLIPQLIDMQSAIISSVQDMGDNSSSNSNIAGSPDMSRHNINTPMQTIDSLKSYSLPQLTQIMSGSHHFEGPCIILAACKADEVLPTNPLYPADIFTCCLTTPISIALRWLILQNPYSLGDVSLDLSENLPGKEGDRKTPRGELYWIFTAITDTIAWSSLPSSTFQKIYRQEMLVATLFRNFLLARRIMKSFSCTCQSWPILPDTSNHYLWQTWDLAAECCLLHVVSMMKGSPMVNPKNNIPLGRTDHNSSNVNISGMSTSAASLSAMNIPPPNLPFFTEQLTAFEIWLDYGSKSSGDIPVYLPIILQVLLSQTHRLRAMVLLKRYLATGPHAINATLLVGIFPYILRLLQSTTNDIRQVLVAIWAHIISYDVSCRQDLIRDKYPSYFIQFISMKEYNPMHRCLAMFILTIICSHNRDGQTICLQQNLHRSCTNILSQAENHNSIAFMMWTALCLSKIIQDFIWAKYLLITEVGHTQLYPLLTHDDPTLRTTTVLTLGEVFGASNLSKPTSSSSMNNLGSAFSSHHMGSNNALSANSSAHGRSYSDMSIGSVESLVDPRELREAELQLALQLLESCTDGCVAVRYEAIIALSKFAMLAIHLPCFTIISRHLMKLNIIESPTKMRQSFSFGPGVTASSTTISSSPQLKPSLHRAVSAPTSVNISKSKSRSTTPDLDSTSSTAADNSNNAEPSFPWNLSATQTQLLVDDVRAYLETQGVGLTPPETPIDPNMLYNHDITQPSSLSSSQQQGSSRRATPSGAQLSNMMAATYVRFWLAIYEVQGKDPHICVAKAATFLCQRILDQIQYEDAKKAWEVSSSSHMHHHNQQISSSTHEPMIPQLNMWSFDSNSHDLQTNMMNMNINMPPNVPLSPLGLGSQTSSPSNRRGRNQGGYSSHHGSNQARPTAFDFQGQQHDSSGAGGHVSWAIGTHPQDFGASSSSQSLFFQPNSNGVLVDDTSYHGDMSPSWPVLASSFYSWTKRMFLNAEELNPNAHDDALTNEGNDRLYRQERFNNIRSLVKKLMDTYKVMDDSQDYQILDRKTREEQQSHRSSAIASMPQSLTKFEQRTILNIDNAKLTSLVMFHALHDVLATCDGHNIKIWSINNGSKIMEVYNAHNHLGSLANYCSNSAHNSGTVGSVLASAMNISSSSISKSRITAMNWINESYESLLMVGTDNGNINVWRDISESSDPSQAFHRTASQQDLDVPQRGISNNTDSSISRRPGYDAHSSLYSSLNSNICIATSFTALPDIAETSRGSGLVTNWIQISGTIVVGGNSPTIRIWDLNTEQCSRVFNTGLDTCTTAIAAKSISSSFFSSSSTSSNFMGTNSQRLSQLNQQLSNADDVHQRSWIFSGFADGTVSIFDERMTSSTNGHAHSARADAGAWIVSAYTRHDLPQVITASVKGTVRFWDIRNMRVYKTLDVFKHPLTALAVHRCLPIMATGSHAQVVKVFTMGGDQLDRDIKYHDGFLGQRIGPVSCLAFHPNKMMLASGASDNLVSIYSPAEYPL